MAAPWRSIAAVGLRDADYDLTDLACTSHVGDRVVDLIEGVNPVNDRLDIVLGHLVEQGDEHRSAADDDAFDREVAHDEEP